MKNNIQKGFGPTKSSWNDITQRKKAELALKESEKKYKSILNSAYNGILLISDKGEIQFWNKAAEKIFGYKKEDVIENKD